jgi:hypothetical protein
MKVMIEKKQKNMTMMKMKISCRKNEKRKKL